MACPCTYHAVCCSDIYTQYLEGTERTISLPLCLRAASDGVSYVGFYYSGNSAACGVGCKQSRHQKKLYLRRGVVCVLVTSFPRRFREGRIEVGCAVYEVVCNAQTGVSESLGDAP